LLWVRNVPALYVPVGFGRVWFIFLVKNIDKMKNEVPAGYKKCGHPGCVKPFSEFYKEVWKSHGLSYFCKEHNRERCTKRREMIKMFQS